MKKTILTIVISLIASVIFAQENTNIPQEFKNKIALQNQSVDFRMSNQMSNEDIQLEFINNFFKLELSDLKAKQHNTNEAKFSSNIISDLAIRTTKEMRPSLNSIEEFIG